MPFVVIFSIQSSSHLPPEGTDELVQLYDSVLRNLLDKHAPLLTCSFHPRPHSPWYKYKSSSNETGTQASRA